MQAFSVPAVVASTLQAGREHVVVLTEFGRESVARPMRPVGSYVGGFRANQCLAQGRGGPAVPFHQVPVHVLSDRGAEWAETRHER
jgi:hypothetical protein